jgi:hypothetical protein
MAATICTVPNCCTPAPRRTGPLGTFPDSPIRLRSPQARTADAIDDLHEQVAALSSVVERLANALESRS